MKKIDEASQKENLDFLISIAKDEYDCFFKRSQILDAKVAIMITIIGSICSFTVKIDYLDELIHNLTIYNYLELLMYIGLIGILIAIVILTAGIVMPRDTYFMPLSILNKELSENENSVELKSKILTESYKSLIAYNDEVLKKKNKKFIVITILSIIEIAIVIVLQIFKIFL